jgi:hypothetical protein
LGQKNTQAQLQKKLTMLRAKKATLIAKKSRAKNATLIDSQPALQKHFAIWPAYSNSLVLRLCKLYCAFCGLSSCIASVADTNIFFHIPPLFTTIIPNSTTTRNYDL